MGSCDDVVHANIEVGALRYDGVIEIGVGGE